MGDSHRTCEICHSQERYSTEKLFYARFPLNVNQCKQWVKAVGKEDLVLVPIEKLHALRHICEKHFQIRDFTKTKTRLKKHAVPKLNLTATPLTDDQLSEFPLHIAKDTNDADKDKEPASQFSLDPDNAVEICDIVEDADIETEPASQFSWDQDNAVVPCDIVEAAARAPPVRKPESPPPPRAGDEPLDHTNYLCNFCSSKITGFRYTCVQCLDVDICSSCEAQQVHATHYVLRIPGPRPLAEVSARLRTIRRALLADAIVNVEDLTSISEIKEEVEETDPIDLESAPTGAQLTETEDVTMYDEDSVTKDDEDAATDESGSDTDDETESNEPPTPSASQEKAISPVRKPEAKLVPLVQPLRLEKGNSAFPFYIDLRNKSMHSLLRPQSATHSKPVLQPSTQSNPIQIQTVLLPAAHSKTMLPSSTLNKPVLQSATHSKPVLPSSTHSKVIVKPVLQSATHSKLVLQPSTQSNPIVTSSTHSQTVLLPAAHSKTMLQSSTLSKPVLQSATHSKVIVKPVLQSATHSKVIVKPVLQSATHSKVIVKPVLQSATHSKVIVEPVPQLSTPTHSKVVLQPVLQTSTFGKPMLVLSTHSKPVLQPSISKAVLQQSPHSKLAIQSSTPSTASLQQSTHSGPVRSTEQPEPHQTSEPERKRQKQIR